MLSTSLDATPVASGHDAATLIAALDGAAALPREFYATLTLSARNAPNAEYVFRLWASARGKPLEDDTWAANGRWHRVLRILRDSESAIAIAQLMFASVEATVTVAAEVTP